MFESTQDIFRLCFRLIPPDAPDHLTTQASGRVSGSPNERALWRLGYFLQVRDDLSLLVPLGVVWQAVDASARFLDQRFGRPGERVLAALEEAARIFAPIARTVSSPFPVECAFGVNEAYQFLIEALPRFEAAGFGVQVPSWWKHQHSPRPQLRLVPSRGTQDEDHLLSLDSLVTFEWRVALGGVELSVEDLEHLVMLKEPLVWLRGEWVEIHQADVDAVLHYLRSRGTGRKSLGALLRMSLTGRNDDGVPISHSQSGGWVGDQLFRMGTGEEHTQVEQPAGLRGELRPYQRRGLNWLAFLARCRLGACLADDMGLGKTITFLALILHLKESGQLIGPALVVCPTSVAGNWAHEAERFAPDLRVLIHHGPYRAARYGGNWFSREVAQHDMVISTYSLLSNDARILKKVDWGIIALDEAQNIKNADTAQSRIARKLSAPVRVALTGTPIENRLDELWSIMDFLNHGYLETRRRFSDHFAWPIEKCQDPEATATLRAIVRPFILRRLKTDPEIAAELPEKVEMRKFCSLTPEQVSLYQAVIDTEMDKVKIAGSRMQRRASVLRLLTRLKQVCNHPAHYWDDDSAFGGRSGKLACLEELLETTLAHGDRTLIFTQYAKLGGRLKDYLQERFDLEVAYLHGSLPRTERTRLVDHFQQPDGPRIFVLSLKTGGTGLNLTAANQVVHFDRWWNPAVEDQATDRAFRIGQTHNVEVHKLICTGTLEERIDQLIEKKRRLADAVVGGGEGWLTDLKDDELYDTVRLRTGWYHGGSGGTGSPSSDLTERAVEER